LNATAYSFFSTEYENRYGALEFLKGGVALVLTAAKAYLEHGIDFNIVADRF
jgi:hypothetical protein